jgi:transposase-like protein
MEPPTKRRKYEASFKLREIKMAKESNNCAAARAFDITEKMVREWRKNEDVIKK